MGDISDYYRTHELDDTFEPDGAEKQKPVFWKTASGEILNVDDMEIEHLRNVVKMLIRREKVTNKT